MDKRFLYVIKIESSGRHCWVTNEEEDPQREGLKYAQSFPTIEEAESRVKQLKESHPLKERNYTVLDSIQWADDNVKRLLKRKEMALYRGAAKWQIKHWNQLILTAKKFKRALESAIVIN